MAAIMKGLSIEEKAKRYDEVIEKVNDYYEGKTKLYSNVDKTLDYLFPELKESEDERIRKIISDILLIDSDEIREILDVNNILMQDIDAWLEKQDTKVSVYKDTLFKIATILSQYEDKDDSPLEKIRSIMIDGTICSMDLESKRKECGEQKPADEEMKILLQTEYEKGRADALQEQRKEWTAEDLLNRNQIADILQEYNRNDLIKWLEMQSKKGTNGNEKEIPNSAWSEKDEEMLNHIICDIESLKKQVYCKTLCDEEITWLKSLKERYTWKPSDEQIEALEFIVHFHTFATKDTREKMEALLNDLKKLREE